MGNLIDPFASFGDVEDNTDTGSLVDPFAAYAPEEPAKKAQEYNEDVGLGEELWSSWGRGSNQLLSGIGTLYGMASGDMDNWAREQGEKGVEYYTRDKSEELLAAEAERAAAIQASDSELGKAGAAVWGTITNPRLFANFLIEQAPMLVPGAGVGRGAALGARALGAGTKLARGAATAGAVGTGAALQTGDVAGQAYEDLLNMPDELWDRNEDYLNLVDEGVDADKAKEQLALRYTREVAPGVAAASLLTQALPGGRTLDKALAGSAVQKIGSSMAGRVVTGALGEAAQEATEEVSGQMLGNLAKSNVNPEQSIWEGTGEAGGLGALGGFAMGAPAGLAGKPNTDIAPGTSVNYTDSEGNPRVAEVLGEVGGTRYKIRNDDGTEQEIGKDLVSLRSDTGANALDDLLNEEAPARPGIVDPVPAGPDPVAEQARTQARELNDEIDSIVGGTSDLVQPSPLEEIPGDVGAASEQIIPLANIEADAAAEAALNESTSAAQAVADTAAAVERTATAVSEITGVDTQTASEVVSRVLEKEGEGVVRSKLEDDTDVEADPVYVSRIVDTVESRMTEGTDYEPSAVKQMVRNWQRNETLAPREVDETAINDFLDGKIEAGEKVTRQEIIDYIEDTSPRAEPGRQKPVAEKVEAIPARPATVREAAQRRESSKAKNAREGGSVRQRVELAVAELGDGATLEAVTKATPGADPALIEKEYTRAVQRRAKKAESGQAELFDIGEVSPQADNMTGEVSPEGDITLDLAEGIEEGFEVKHRRDGSVLVSGDVTAIRSRLPGNIKGRLNKAKTGLLFSHNQAPRVVSAMRKGGVEAAGGATYGRGGRVLKQKPMKAGKYVGAPETGNTRGKIAGWRKRLKALAVEGEYGRHWYRDSAKSVMEFAGGRLEDAKVLIALMSIYSPQAKVDANTTFALRAWAQYKAGMPVRVKTGTQDEKAAMAIAGDPAFWEEFWSGEKTGNFYKNLMKGIDPEVSTKQGATIDLWMIRAGEYTPGEAPNEQPNAGQYAFMEDETARIAEELGWSPEEVQAAIWVAMKARMENPGVKAETERTSEAKGWIRFDRVDGKKVRVILDADKHSANWVKHAKDHVPDEVDKDQAGFHYGHGVARHLGQISWEPKISSKLPHMRGLQTAPYEQQLAYFAAIKEALFPGGKDELARRLGVLVDHDYSATPGVWEGEVSPSGQIRAVMAPDKAGVIYTNFETMERLNEAQWEAAGKPAEFVKHPGIDQGQFKLLEIYSAVLGLVLQQDGVGFHRMFTAPSMVAANAIEFKLQRPLSPNETMVLESELRKGMVEGMRGANVKAIEKAELARAKEANKERTDAAETPEEQKAARASTKLQNAAARAKAAADAATLNDSPATRREMATAAQDVGIITTADGVRVVNFGAISDNKLFHQIAKSVFETAVDPEAEVLYGYSDGTLVGNDWEGSPDGQDYVRTINDRGRSDILDYANSDLRPRVEQVNKEFSELFGWGEPRVGGDARAQEGNGGTNYGTPQAGSVSVQGIHFSRDSRTELDSTQYGTGLKGAERVRLSSPSADPAIQNRTYFYVDEGSGVRPEGGVGAQAHHVQLENLYDGGKDPQGLVSQAKQAWPNNPNEQANEFDRLVVEAGFDGVYVPAAFGQQGAAVLIGKHKVPVAQGMPSQARPTVSERAPREVMADRLAQSNLPGGRMRGSAWAARIKGTEFDSEQAQEALAARSQDVLYRADLADILTEETAEVSLDLPTAKGEVMSDEEAATALDEIAAPGPKPRLVNRRNQVEKQGLLDRIMGKLGGAKATVVKLRPGQAMIVRAMERLLGKEIIVFEGGIVDGLASGRYTDVLFVSRTAEQPVLTVLGHEFLHQIRNTNPKLYIKVVEAMIRVHGRENIKRIAEEQMRFRNEAAIERGISIAPLDLTKAVEEVIADLVGASFSDPAFWQALAKETGIPFATKLATKWQEFLQSTIEFVNAYSPRAIRLGWMQDVQANNQIVLEMLLEYRETMPADVRGEEIELTENEEVALDLTEDTSMPAPKKTVKAYKMFRAKAGKLYPLFIDADVATPIGEWVKAVVGNNEKSKIGKLALRPGWHAGDFPTAKHIGGKDKGAKAPTFRKPDQVWAEVELPADVDWQSEAESRASRNKKTGAIIPRTAEIKGEVPLGGHYRYKTNPNMEGEWLIAGGLKVNRVLTDQEVADINRAGGVEDLPRKQPLDLEGLSLDIPAYHGTGGTVDKFSTDKIGSGEGNAAFGWGLYFASKKEVGEFYREKLGKKAGTKGNLYHVELAPTTEELVKWDSSIANQPAGVRKVLESLGLSTFSVMENGTEVANYTDRRRAKRAYPNAQIVEMPPKNGGVAYRMLERAFGEPTSVTVSRLREMGLDPTSDLSRFNNDQLASMYLHSRGVRGVQFLDSSSRARGEGGTNYVVFNDADVEIKDNISLAIPNTNPGATPGWEPPVALSLWDRFRILLQNKYLTLVMAQDAITASGATIRQKADARNMQKRYPGVVKAKLVEFEEIYLKPVQEFMRATTHSAADIGKYLMARHIILDGVNARLARLNPTRQNNDALSGMTDAEAQAILNRYANDPDMARVARLIDRMNREKVQLLLDEGILSQTEADRWTRAYQHYMPLNREDLGHTFAGGVGGGGFQQKGRLSKIRGGSHKALDFENALGSVFGQYEAAIIRIEKNRVAGALYQLASDHPASDFWEVDNFPVEKKLVNGVITYVPNTQDAGMIPFKVDGETKWIWMKTQNPVAASLAKQWKNEDTGMGEVGSVFMKPLMGFMRYQSMINTSLSPEFVISNFMRDIQTAGITMQDTEIKGHTMKVMKSVLPAIKGIGEALFSNKPLNQMSEYAQLYKEMEKAGGTMGWIAHYENVNDRTRAITRAVNRGRTAEIGVAVFDFIGDVNQAVENGVRLAAYKVAKETLMSRGLSAEDAIAKAAVVSRELTVDFQEKGSAGSLVNAGYLFFNASMQGTFRLARAAIKSKRARMGLAGITILSYLTHLAAMLGDDDDEYKMISASDRERNLIIPDPIWGGYFKIPLGWGLNVFSVIGQEAAEATLSMMGEMPEYSIPKSGVRLMTAMLNAFNPVNDGSLVLTMSPTIFDPIVKVLTNTDWHGGNLFPDYEEKQADYLKYFRSSSEVSQKATETLARWTRKADGTPAIDMSPETVDMVYDTLTGSMGKFYADLYGTVSDVATGDIGDREVRKLPMIRKLWKEVDDSDRQRYAFTTYNEFGRSYQAWRDNKDNQEWMQDIATPKMRQAWSRYKRLDSDKRKINKRISKAVEFGQEDREKELRKEKVDMMVNWVEDHHEIMYRED